MYTIEHLMMVLFFITFGFLLLRWSKKLTTKQQFVVGNIFAFSISLSVIVWTIMKVYQRGFDIKNDLPFHLCNLIALLLPIFSITRKYIIYEIILFWILAGTAQAVFTPDIKVGFPNYQFLKYWYVHAGLIVFIFYATYIYQMKPTFKSIFKSFIALQFYVLFMMFINKITGANYFYISRKPDGATMLDYMGEWPYYLLVTELILIPYFLLIYLPFYLYKRKNILVQ